MTNKNVLFYSLVIYSFTILANTEEKGIEKYSSFSESVEIEEIMSPNNQKKFKQKIDREMRNAARSSHYQSIKTYKTLDNLKGKNLTDYFRFLFEKLLALDDDKVVLILDTIEKEMQRRHGRNFTVNKLFERHFFRRSNSNPFRETSANPFHFLKMLMNKIRPGPVPHKRFKHKKTSLKTDENLSTDFYGMFFDWLSKLFGETESVLTKVISILSGTLSHENSTSSRSKTKLSLLRQGPNDENSKENLVSKINTAIKEILTLVAPDDKETLNAKIYNKIKENSKTNIKDLDAEKNIRTETKTNQHSKENMSIQYNTETSGSINIDLAPLKTEKSAQQTNRVQNARIDESVMIAKKIIDLAVKGQNSLQKQKQNGIVNNIYNEQRITGDFPEEKNNEKNKTSEKLLKTFIEILSVSSSSRSQEQNNTKMVKSSIEQSNSNYDTENIKNWKEQLRQGVKNKQNNFAKIKNRHKTKTRYDVVFRSIDDEDNTGSFGSRFENLQDASNNRAPAIFARRRSAKTEKTLPGGTDIMNNPPWDEYIVKKPKKSFEFSTSDEVIRFPRVKLKTKKKHRDVAPRITAGSALKQTSYYRRDVSSTVRSTPKEVLDILEDIEFTMTSPNPLVFVTVVDVGPVRFRNKPTRTTYSEDDNNTKYTTPTASSDINYRVSPRVSLSIPKITTDKKNNAVANATKSMFKKFFDNDPNYE